MSNTAVATAYNYTDTQVNNFTLGIASCNHELNLVKKENFKHYLTQRCTNFSCKKSILINDDKKLYEYEILKHATNTNNISHKNCHIKMLEMLHCNCSTDCMRLSAIDFILYSSASELVFYEIDQCNDESCFNSKEKVKNLYTNNIFLLYKNKPTKLTLDIIEVKNLIREFDLKINETKDKLKFTDNKTQSLTELNVLIEKKALIKDEISKMEQLKQEMLKI